jgi:hypothetical protein
MPTVTRPARHLVHALLALLPLLSIACGGSDGGGGGGGTTGTACSIAYAGGVTETVWCDAPVLRSNGSGGYYLSVMAFRGAPASLDQAGEVRAVFNVRPVVDTDYGWVGATTSSAIQTTVSWESRTAASSDTHLAIAGSSGAFSVRFTTIPATDGPDPTGFDGIGTVHGTFTATLVPTGVGSDVTANGSF